MKVGCLYLIPSAIGVDSPRSFLPDATLDITYGLRFFIAERAKTSRAFLKAIGHPVSLEDLEIRELEKHTENDFQSLLQPCYQGKDVGLLSESGAPAVADPGALVVRAAHESGIVVRPLVGPSSLLLALMASGLNGQSFAFHGYLSRDEKELGRELRELESESQRKGTTQMFIETPYRNMRMMTALRQYLRASTLLCAASNLCSNDEQIITLSMADWKKLNHNIDRKPTVFLILAKK